MITNKAVSTDQTTVVSTHSLIVRALRKSGHGAVCKAEKRDYTLGSERLSVSLLIVILLSLAFYSTVKLGWSLQTTVGTLFGSLLLVMILVLGGMSPRTPYYAYLLLWGISAIHIIFRGDAAMGFMVYGLSIAIVLGSQWSYRALHSAARLPLFLPVAFIIVLVPLLTEDPWKFASEARIHLLWLAFVATIPLTTLLILKLLRTPVAVEIKDAVDRLGNTENPAAQAAKVTSKMTAQSERAELDEDRLATFLAPAYIKSFRDKNIDAISRPVARKFKILTIRRLVTLLLGIGTATYALIYVLAWVAMPISLAERWSGRTVPSRNINFLGLSIDLPLGPYLLVAALFAIFATAGFLAFSSTEDRYEAAIFGSVVARPADQLVLLALPFIYVSGNRMT